MPPISTMRCLQIGLSPGCDGSLVGIRRLSLMVTIAPKENFAPSETLVATP